MRNEKNIWYFEDVDLYSVFCPHRQKRIGSEHEYTTLKKGEFVYFQNEPSTMVYLIAKGRVKIGTYSNDGKEVIKAVLSPGEIFGEMAILGEEKRRDFAQALEELTLCPLNVEDMECMMQENQDFSLKVTRLIGFKLKRAERKIESLVFKDARTRVIEFLAEMATRDGQKVGYETLVKYFYTHQDIANLTATSRQTVTTILNELRDKNLINFDRKRLLIRDVTKLEEELLQ